MKRLIALICACFALGTAHAVPVNFAGTVINGSGGGGSWSWLHGCATPQPCNFLLGFKPGQGIHGYIDLEEGELVARSNAYDLYGTNDDFYMHELDLQFDTDGDVTYGTMTYTYLGESGTFDFNPMSMGYFNSLVFDMQDDELFSAYLWGGDGSWSADDTSGLGIDFAFTAQIPEPGTLALFGLGLLGLVAGRRKRV